MSNVRDLVRSTVIVIGGLVAVAAFALPAAAGPAERIPTYDVLLRIGSDGVLHVRETITYDFDEGEHGITRRVPYRIKNRLYDIRNVRTSSSTGAPARAKAAKLLHEIQISVGDERRKVQGRQAYVIEYDVVGGFTPRGPYDDLRWDAIGSGWDVPIGEVSVRVEAPVLLRKVSCRAGAAKRGYAPGDLTPCLRDRDGPYAIDFTQSGLTAHESVLIRVLLPRGAVKVPAPKYARPHFQSSWPGFAALAAGVIAAAVIWLRRPPVPRRAGVALLAAGAAALLLDAADDVVRHGLWAASIGDLALAGAGLAIAGIMIVVAAARRADGDQGAEQGASADQRA